MTRFYPHWGTKQDAYPTQRERYDQPSYWSIPPKSKVLFFAGAAGDWAHELAHTMEVHYTDASKAMTQHAQTRFGDNRTARIKSFRTANAMRWPVKLEYDYLASFEPAPLIEIIPLITLRALAHSKGIRIARSGLLMDKLYKIGPKMKALYAANYLDHTSEMEIEDYTGRIGSKHVDIWSVNTTPEAKKRAELDLKVIALLQKHQTISVKQLKEKLGSDGRNLKENTLNASLQRINHISKLICDISHEGNVHGVRLTG
ncbi:MAG: hypothetical protein Q8R15_01710 [Candidatus Micrarchaeota archaeon]|nr:hypothetical protein [Candidatus Micrarchaeota archaeon]